jgi:predicted cobalt transporter CbtA
VLRLDPARPRSVLRGAAVIGLAAGLVAALFLTYAGEPAVEAAIAIEEAHAAAAAAGHEVGQEAVSRGTQRGVGLFGAYALTGGAFGLLFGAAFLGLRRGRPDPFRRALVAGGLLAGALTVSPWLKYPPNPPAVGDPATLASRQLLHLAVIVLTAVVLAGAAHLSGRLRAAGWEEARRVAAVAAAVAVPLALAYAVLPPPPDAVEVPAALLWRFRLASLGGNLLLWAALTLGFGVVASRRRQRVAV